MTPLFFHHPPLHPLGVIGSGCSNNLPLGVDPFSGQSTGRPARKPVSADCFGPIGMNPQTSPIPLISAFIAKKFCSGPWRLI